MYYQEAIITNITQELNNTLPEAINAFLPENSFQEVIYGKIIAIPSEFNLGNVSTDINRQIEVWNATTNQQNLLSVDEAGFDGITLTGDKSGLLSANSSFQYDLDVSSQGGASINALISFNFDGLNYVPTITITGSRIVLWGYRPDFSENPVVIYQYNTSIQTFYQGDESRYQNIIVPKMAMSSRYLHNKKDARKIQNIMNSVSAKDFLVPNYTKSLKLTEATVIGSSIIKLDSVFDFEVGQFCFMGEFSDNYLLGEIISIDTINNELQLKDHVNKIFRANQKVHPVYECRTSGQNSITKITDEIIETNVEFNVIDNKVNTLKDNPDVVFNMFNGKILMDVRPNFVSLTDEYGVLLEDLNNGFGVNERIIQEDEADIYFDYAFICKDEADIDYFKQFVFENKGQLKDFWIPSYFNDMQLKEDITPTQTTLFIENNDHFSLGSDKQNRKALLLELTDGRKFVKEIVNFLPEDDNVERVVLFSNFGEFISINQVRRIEFVYNARLNTDTLAINNLTDTTALIDLSFKTVKE